MKLSLCVLSLCVFAIGQTNSNEDLALRGAELSREYFLKIVAPKPFEGDPLGDLRPNSPEVLHRTATYLQNNADDIRQLLSTVDVLSVPIANTRQARILKMSFAALLDLKLIESRVFLPQWVKWWDSKNKLIPFDTRLDADRFAAYAIERMHGRLSDKVDQFEQIFDEQYLEALSHQKDLGESKALGDTCGEARVSSSVAE